MNDDLTNLLNQLSQRPNDDDLLGKIALYYIHNPDGDKDLYYLKQAYQTNPNIKNINNYAYWIDYEYGKSEKALDIIKSILSLQVDTFYPYATYAQILFSLDNESNTDNTKNYQTIIDCCHQALVLFNQLDKDKQDKYFHKKLLIKNNLVITLAKVGQFNDIYQIFDEIYQDMNDKSYQNHDWQLTILLNHAYIALMQNDITTARHCLRDIENYMIDYDNCDIAQVYAMINDGQKCMELIKDHIDKTHISWNRIWYEIFKENPTIWKNKIQEELLGDRIWLKEEITSLKLSQDDQEKQTLMENIQFHEQNIAYYERLLQQGKPDIPNDEPIDHLRCIYGCYLMDCQTHDDGCF